MNVEDKVIELLQRMERVTVMQENSARNCNAQVKRIELLEEQQENIDIRVAEVQEATATLHELVMNLQNTYRMLQRLALGLAMLLLLSVLLLTMVGYEALPYLVKLAEIIF